MSILDIVEKLSGGTCYQTTKFSLDHVVLPRYDDSFNHGKIFETDNKKGKNISLLFDDTLNIDNSVCSLFAYFLDGTRRTYKVADFGTTDGKFLPIVAGQIGAAICFRQEGKVKKHLLKHRNVLTVPNRIDDLQKIQEEISKVRKRNLSIEDILSYEVKDRPESPFENLAIAKIQTTMQSMEIELIREMIQSKKLKTHQMLMVDGSLQFSGVQDSDTVFQNVIGVSKSFNPNLQGILKSKNKQIGSYLIELDFGQRTPVYFYETENKKIKIGAWYLRIRPKKQVKKPLDGVIKIEKIATTAKERDDGFDTDMINEISRSILLERNVTCYGNDDRWANHLYPIYLTELFLKNSFVSDTFFLGIF